MREPGSAIARRGYGLYLFGLLWQYSQASASLVGPGLDGPYLEPAGRNHFTVLDELGRADSDLQAALIRLARAR